MTPGNVDFVEELVSMIGGTGMVVAVVLLDERRLEGGALARAWPPSSRLAAFFLAWAVGWPAGCVALMVYFVRTRGSLRGVNLGLLWAAALYCVADEAPEQLVPAVIDWLHL